MLIHTFRHVDVQLSELGNHQTVNSYVEHRLAPPGPSPGICWMTTQEAYLEEAKKLVDRMTLYV